MNKRAKRIKDLHDIPFFIMPIAITIMVILVHFLYITTIQKRSTYSIVAVDPVTGDVGAAGASCVPISASFLAVLAPGQGAGAIQAAGTPANQAKVFDLLRQGATAREIIRQVSDDTYDPEAGIRQYGVVTLQGGHIQTAGFTGSENNDWAGDRQDSTYAVSVQGNTLESEAVVSDALAAFSATDIGPVELPDRLMRALEAASAAGGDRRCNNLLGFQQTAQAAFIMFARADQPPFKTSFGKEPSPNDPALPWLYISFIEAKGGPNPLLELRSRYDTWRSKNLPPCTDCKLEAIPVPPGGTPKPIVKATLNLLNQVGLGWTAVLCCLTTILVFIALLITLYSRRKQHPSAAP